jgi:hypothetical protein
MHKITVIVGVDFCEIPGRELGDGIPIRTRRAFATFRSKSWRYCSFHGSNSIYNCGEALGRWRCW